MKIPVSGGGYFRLYPYKLTKNLLRYCNEKEQRPFVFYLHPWEIDPEQPRVKLPFIKSFRHYNNLKYTETRLEKLLQDFDFTTIRNVLGL